MGTKRPRGRILSVVGGHRLWDRAGHEFALEDDELERDEILRLLDDRSVQVAVHLCAGPLRWVDGDERRVVWRDEIAPNFHDVPGWKPPGDAPGQLPFHAQLWSDSEAGRVVLFTDLD